MRTRTSVVATAAIMLFATSAPALATRELRFLDVCLGTESEIDAMTQSLSQFGWNATTEASETLTNGLAWIGTAQYLAPDSGGEVVETILALKEKTAAGLLRKKDISQSKGRFLTRQNDVLHVMWRKPTPSITEVECHAALSGPTAAALRADSEGTETAFTQLPTQKVRGGQVFVSLLDADKFPLHTPPTAVVRTYISSQSQ